MSHARDTNKALMELRAELIQKYGSIVEKGKSRHLSSEERGELGELEADIDEVERELGPALRKVDKAKAQVRARHPYFGNGDEDENIFDFSEHVNKSTMRCPASFDESRFQSEHAFEIYKRAVPKSGPISDWVRRNYDVSEAEEQADLGKIISALALPNYRPDAITEGAIESMRSAVGGSSTLTEYLSARLWEAGISKSRLAEAGMKTFIMEEPTVRFPKITEYPSLEWKAENAQTTDRDITISSVDGVARTLRGFTTISGELSADGHDIHRAIRRAFAVSAANSIDTGGLYGDDIAPNPRGLVSLANINVKDASYSNMENYDMILDVIEMVLNDNDVRPDTAIMSPSQWILLNKLKNQVEGEYQRPPLWMALEGFQMLETSKVNYSEIFFGGFDRMHLGIRLDTQIIISPVLSDTFQHNILCVSRGQFFTEREECFGMIENLQLT